MVWLSKGAPSLYIIMRFRRKHGVATYTPGAFQIYHPIGVRPIGGVLNVFAGVCMSGFDA